VQTTDISPPTYICLCQYIFIFIYIFTAS